MLVARTRVLELENTRYSEQYVGRTCLEFQMLSPYNEIFLRQRVLEAWYLKINGLISLRIVSVAC